MQKSRASALQNQMCKTRIRSLTTAYITRHDQTYELCTFKTLNEKHASHTTSPAVHYIKLTAHRKHDAQNSAAQQESSTMQIAFAVQSQKRCRKHSEHTMTHHAIDTTTAKTTMHVRTTLTKAGNHAKPNTNEMKQSYQMNNINVAAVLTRS